MLTATLDELATFPGRLEHTFREIPPAHWNWKPASWAGIPSEELAALEQLCHVRDIEIDGYQVRFRRLLESESPVLESLDGYMLARERRYGEADPDTVLAEIRSARLRTLESLRMLSAVQLARSGRFEDRPVTVAGLIHLLCSHDQQHLAGLQWLLARISSESDVR